jgi:hypothetical protein
MLATGLLGAAVLTGFCDPVTPGWSELIDAVLDPFEQPFVMRSRTPDMTVIESNAAPNSVFSFEKRNLVFFAGSCEPLLPS